MLYKRTISSTLKTLIKHYPVIMLTGPRQVGKTTTLRNLETRKEFKYISLDNPLVRAEAKSNPELFLQRNKPPLIIDEIQYADELLPYIKIIVDIRVIIQMGYICSQDHKCFKAWIILVSL